MPCSKIVLFVWFDALRLSQKLWSCLDMTHGNLLEAFMHME